VQPDIRWNRVATVATVTVVSLGLLVLLTSRPRTEPEERIEPVLALAHDQARIVEALIERYADLGAPLPPPEPGKSHQDVRKEPLLVSETAELCGVTDGVSDHDCLDHRYLETVSPTLVKALILGNGASRTQPAEVRGVEFATPKAVEAAFSGDWWPAFHQQYPQKSGILVTSWSVLSDSGQRALVYVSFTCGGLCGHGDLVVLSRFGSGWKIEAVEGIWVS
jgi:hypothetical protein